MGTPYGIQCPFPFTHILSLDEHLVQHTCSAHLLSWSLSLQPKYKKYAFFIVGVIEDFLEANVTSLRIQQKLSGLFMHFWDIFINILHNLWEWNASWNYHDTILM